MFSIFRDVRTVEVGNESYLCLASMSYTADGASLHKERKLLSTASGENASSTFTSGTQRASWPNDPAVSFLRKGTAETYCLMPTFRPREGS
jgi:hypothetical protein